MSFDLIESYKEFANIPDRFRNSTLKNFEVSDHNRESLKKVKEYSDYLIKKLKNDQDGKDCSGLYLYGGTGVGKTHLAAGIANMLIAEMVSINEKILEDSEVHNSILKYVFNNKDPYFKGKFEKSNGFILNLFFIDVRGFIDIQKKHFGAKEQHIIYDKVKNANLLIMDDLGNEPLTDWVLDVIFGIIYHRYNYCKPTIYTSNLDVSSLGQKYNKKIPDIEVERFVSRIHEVSVGIEIMGDDYRLKNRSKINGI